MFDKNLERTLNTVFEVASRNRHEYVTVEHLLFGLIKNPEAAEVLSACGVNLKELASDLAAYISKSSPRLELHEPGDIQQTRAFQRVLQRAVFHVQSVSPTSMVKGENVLVSVFSEPESQAVYLLGCHNVERLDIVNYIAHGISKYAGKENEVAGVEGGESGRSVRKPLEQFTRNLNEKARAGRIESLVAEWHQLGIKLGLRPAQLYRIEKEHPHDIERLKVEVFVLWLQSTPGASWRHIVTALTEMGDLTSAERIELKYVKGTRGMTIHCSMTLLKTMLNGVYSIPVNLASTLRGTKCSHHKRVTSSIVTVSKINSVFAVRNTDTFPFSFILTLSPCLLSLT